MENHCYHPKRVTSPLLDELIVRLDRILILMERSSREFNAMLQTDPAQTRLSGPSLKKVKMEPPNRSYLELPEAPHRQYCPKIADMQLMLELNQIHVRLGELIAELEREKGLRPSLKPRKTAD